MKVVFTSAAFLGAVMLATASGAQPQGTAKAVEEVMIRVDLAEVTSELAFDMRIEEDAVPRSIELPVDAAAEVCEFTADQLAFFATSEQHLECSASLVTEELAEAATEAREFQKEGVK